jgi:hypothetical protein
MPAQPKIHYRRARGHAECALPRPPVPDGQLTENLLAVTCGQCRRSIRYRADARAAAEAARHAQPGLVVLNPEFLHGRPV